MPMLLSARRQQFVTALLLWVVSCWLLIAFVCPSDASAEDARTPPDGLRLFYTGHSFHMFVPSRVEQLVIAAGGIKGHKLVGTQGIGGSRVIQHWDLPDDRNKAKAALISGEVDVFTMAAHLTIPDQGIANFAELGLEHNPKLRLLVQASWYPFDLPDEKRIRNNEQRDDIKIDDLQAGIDQWRTKLEAQADELNKQHDRQAVFIVPVGDAVVKLRAMIVAGTYPGVTRQSELFRDPIGHGGPHIQALAAYCNFAAIYRISPEGLRTPGQGIDAAQEAILQKLAWETVSSYAYAGVVTSQIRR